MLLIFQVPFDALSFLRTCPRQPPITLMMIQRPRSPPRVYRRAMEAQGFYSPLLQFWEEKVNNYDLRKGELV